MPKSIPTALAAILLAAAATLPTWASGLAVIIDETTALIPTDVTYRSTPEGLEVEGWVEKRRPHPGHMIGHVEIRLLDGKGQVLAEEDAYLTHFSPTSSNPQRASFSTVLTVVPSGAATIEVAHRVGDSDAAR